MASDLAPDRPASDAAPVLTTITRSGRIESWHRGAVAVWHDDAPLLTVGPATAEIYCRSATKPLQALPFLERGLDREFGLGDAECAVMCASHDGSERHVEVVRGFLQRGGFDPEQLGCGPSAPINGTARQLMLAAGQEPTRLHNNCSGKHTGFLYLARACGDGLGRYLDPESNGQREVRTAVAAMAGVRAPAPLGVDGCGAPTFYLPLLALARAFARLANPFGLGPVRAAACQRILAAVAAEPVLLAGERRLCTALVRCAPGRIFPKNGAEGVYAVALAPDPSRRSCPGGVGIAIKVHDGEARGYKPVVVDLLRHLGCFHGEVPEPLRGFMLPPVHNTLGEQVGEMRCAVDWGRA